MKIIIQSVTNAAVTSLVSDQQRKERGETYLKQTKEEVECRICHKRMVQGSLQQHMMQQQHMQQQQHTATNMEQCAVLQVRFLNIEFDAVSPNVKIAGPFLKLNNILSSGFPSSKC